MEKIPMTRAGHTALETELKHLKSVERPAIIKAIAEAREQSRKGRTGVYDVRVSNGRDELVALFRGKSYKVRGPVIHEAESEQ